MNSFVQLILQVRTMKFSFILLILGYFLGTSCFRPQSYRFLNFHRRSATRNLLGLRALKGITIIFEILKQTRPHSSLMVFRCSDIGVYEIDSSTGIDNSPVHKLTFEVAGNIMSFETGLTYFFLHCPILKKNHVYVVYGQSSQVK